MLVFLKVLKDFPVEEVLEISAGTHPLSRVPDVKAVEKWFPSPRKVDPLEGYAVGDTAIAQMVSKSITKRFPSVRRAAKSVVMLLDTLKDVILGKYPTHKPHTWTGLSALTGLPEVELRALNDS